jgi:hypothetical protein
VSSSAGKQDRPAPFGPPPDRSSRAPSHMRDLHKRLQLLLMTFIIYHGLRQAQNTQKMSDPKHPQDDPTHSKSLWGGDVPFKKDLTVADCLQR